MVGFSVRPRFTLRAAVEPEQLRQHILAGLRERPDCGGQSVPGHVDLWIDGEQQHAWSPWLGVELRGRDGATEVSGLFGPAPSVWTLFAMIYAVFAFGTVLGVMFGWAQLIVEMPAWGFAVAFGCGLGLAAAVFGARYGQRLGADQMDVLRDFLEERVASAAAVEEPAA